MAEFLNKFKAWIIAGIGILLYWLGRKDEKSNKSTLNRKDSSMRYIKRMWLVILVLSLSGLNGCTTNIADLEFCQIYEPVLPIMTMTRREP